MPYISEEDRRKVDPEINNLLEIMEQCFTPDELDGVLNYVVSRIVSEGLDVSATWRYANIARATAVFECAKLEFYRRIAAPKEDKAIAQNGDIPNYADYNRRC